MKLAPHCWHRQTHKENLFHTPTLSGAFQKKYSPRIIRSLDYEREIIMPLILWWRLNKKHINKGLGIFQLHKQVQLTNNIQKEHTKLNLGCLFCELYCVKSLNWWSRFLEEFSYKGGLFPYWIIKPMLSEEFQQFPSIRGLKEKIIGSYNTNVTHHHRFEMTNIDLLNYYGCLSLLKNVFN